MDLMRRIITISFALAAGALFTGDIGAIPRVGDKAPMFYLKTLKDEYFDLKEHCGENELTRDMDKSNVVLIFFNTTCIPCIRSIYEMKVLYEDYREKGFKVFLISVDKEKEDNLSMFVYRHKVPFPIVIDKYNIVAKIYGAEQTIPSVFLLDKKGLVRLAKYGFSVSLKDELLAAMNKLVKAEPDKEVKDN